MHEIIFHLIGDYILQTEQMAVRKLRSWFWAILHAVVYSLPFLLVIQRWECWLVITGTHAVIDRMAIASTICRIKNLIWFGPDAPEKEQNTGYGIETPPFVRFWLVVIVDNTLHLSINHVALTYLNQ